jgi:integrase
MLHCGPRLFEVISIKPGDINLSKGKLRIKSRKGDKDRDLAIPDYLITLLESWRKIRPKSSYFSRL